jgi:hypothetical protein
MKRRRGVRQDQVPVVIVFILAGSLAVWHGAAYGKSFSVDQRSRIRLAIARLSEAGDLPPVEPREIARRAGNNPQAILSYIRTYFTFDPYCGALRGSRGALLSDAGNDVDLMLLLQDAIHSANKSIPMRYVHGPWPQNYKPQRRQAKPLPSLSADQLAQVTGFDLHEVESALSKVEDPHIARLNSSISEESAAISGELKAMKFKQSSSPCVPSEHWWLRAQIGEHSIDLDPLFETGDAIHKAGVEVSELPSSLYHRIGLQLLLQRIQDNKLVEEVLYRQEWKAADLAGMQVSVEILPEDFGSSNLDAVLSNANRFQAMIQVGDHEIEYGRVFDLEGALYSAKNGKFVKTIMGTGVAGLGQSVFDQLAHGPGRSAPASSPGQLATLRLQIQISSPGQSTRTYRRWILNRLDTDSHNRFAIAPGWHSLRMVRASICRSYELLPVLGPVGPSMITRDVNLLLKSQLLDQAAAMFGGTAHPDPSKLDRAPTVAETSLSSVALLGQSLSGPNATPLFSRPGVFLYRESLQDASRSPDTEKAIDIVAVGATETTLEGAVHYGVAISYAELDAGGGPAAIQSLSASRRAGIPFRLLQSTSDLRGLGLPESVKDTISEQLARGDAVLLPRNPPAHAPVVWWRIDPADGVPIATSPDGEGQAIVEGTGLLREVSIPQVERTLTYVACLNKAIIGRGNAPQQANAECLCEFIGGNLNSSAEKAFRTYGISGSLVNDYSGLGPQVKLMLSESIKYIDKISGFPPKQPIKFACQKITGAR